MDTSDQQEYKWEMEYHMEIWQLCFTPCGMNFDINIDAYNARDDRLGNAQK